MKKPLTLILVLEVVAINVLSACQSEKTEFTSIPLSPTATIPVQNSTLATPYALRPAAGICASFESELVVVTLNPDVPDPRCSKVRPDQKLKVINQTQITLQVSLGNFLASLVPGAVVVFDTPIGDYLATGVHQLQVSPCCGPELWLEGNR
jgi:hypothetical protein